MSHCHIFKSPILPEVEIGCCTSLPLALFSKQWAGVIHASGSSPDYPGIVHGYVTSLGTGSGGHTVASAWSNIDSHFNLND